MDRVLKVLVVDDSAYVRKVVKQMLSRSPFLEVVGTARDGREALELTAQLEPDVITCDLIMPGLDGVGFVREQMARRAVPIIIMSIASETGEAALTALDAGAVDFVQKPTALATEKIFEVSDELIEKVKAAASIHMSRVKIVSPLSEAEPPRALASVTRNELVDIVVIGISTGGPQALKQLIPQLPADFPVPVAMVMHMPVGYTEMYASKLNEHSPLDVREAHEGDELRAGSALLAQAGRHLTFRRRADGAVVAHLDSRPFEMPHRPSVDVLFQSAAEVYGQRVLGVVMTGMGSDGRAGSAWIKAQGGLIYTESEETCVVYGMPGSVVEAGLSDRSVPLDQMARAIREAV
ncbi:MAG: two-component system, chemotaxis family, protein-glutamate methylesterase/glutaminase [Acidobacteriota bacterium]|jgi:two-component system chemotaxis response regulator CheB|nr:two-component system, chemotaxis family, protein-glutamate methylesterase/glutaminase [Acidobacteriota bacterium]